MAAQPDIKNPLRIANGLSVIGQKRTLRLLDWEGKIYDFKCQVIHRTGGTITVAVKHGIPRFVISSVLAILSSLACAEEFALKKAFGDDVSLSQSKTSASVEYCPDSTCARFELTGPDVLPYLHDFVYLYLFACGESTLSRDFKAKGGAPWLAAILDRGKKHCAETDTTELTRCTLDGMRKGVPIRFYAVRYDEGFRCVTPESLLRSPGVGKEHCTNEKSGH